MGIQTRFYVGNKVRLTDQVLKMNGRNTAERYAAIVFEIMDMNIRSGHIEYKISGADIVNLGVWEDQIELVEE